MPTQRTLTRRCPKGSWGHKRGPVASGWETEDILNRRCKATQGGNRERGKGVARLDGQGKGVTDKGGPEEATGRQ